MRRAKIEDRWRVQIPKEIRDKAGFRCGDEVEIEVEDGKVIIKPLFDLENFSKELKGCVSKSRIHPLEVKRTLK